MTLAGIALLLFPRGIARLYTPDVAIIQSTVLLLAAGAVAVGALRVASAQHFPSDVVGGAAIGVGLGWLIPTIHPTVP